MISGLRYLLPWEFSPTVLLACTLTAALYLRGLRVLRRRGERISFWAALSFLVGLGLIYGVMQTYYDYLAQHMFFVHRLQHLVLHHLGPILIVVAWPGRALRAALPPAWRERIARLPRWRPAAGALRLLQQPVIAGALFVGLVYFWLTPSIHFTAMLDATRYRLMNWSMAIDGVMFWWLMLTPRRDQGTLAVAYGPRIAVLIAAAVLQMILGAYIAMSRTVLFDVYGICGRAWQISALTDQQLGGLFTWIPPAMMSVIGVLVVIHHLLREASVRESALHAASLKATP